MAERKEAADVISASAVEEKAAETQKQMDAKEDEEPEFPPLSAAQQSGGRFMQARIPVPPHRYHDSVHLRCQFGGLVCRWAFSSSFP